MQFYYDIADQFPQKFKMAVRIYILFLEEIVLTKLLPRVSKICLFYILLTLQQSLQNFPLELKIIKFRCLTKTGKSEKNYIHLEEQHRQLRMIKLAVK